MSAAPDLLDLRLLFVTGKGGVGKTTVAANLGAELANRGRRVLMIDMDPQASLTLSFYASDELAKEFTDSGTLLHWFSAFIDDQAPQPLRDYVVTPPRVNDVLRSRGGRLDLIPSHLGLIDIDLDLAAHVGGGPQGRLLEAARCVVRSRR